MDRAGSAEWRGNLKEGQGTLRLGTGAFEAPYSFATRFGDTPGTNPEELIATAHAACFSMAFSNALDKAGLKPRSVRTTAKVHLALVGGGFQISAILLDCITDVPGATPAQLTAPAHDAKANCPVSKALAAVPITLNLNGQPLP